MLLGMQPLNAVQQACKLMLGLGIILKHQLMGGGSQTWTKDNFLPRREAHDGCRYCKALQQANIHYHMSAALRIPSREASR